MSVDQIDVIDAISTDRTSGAVALNIMDHLPWDEGHLKVLEKKLATYVRFVETGQVFEDYPNARGSQISVRIYLKFRPTQLGAHFLEAAKQAVSARGLTLTYSPIPDLGYTEMLDESPSKSPN